MSQTIDVTGLSPPTVRLVESLVTALRGRPPAFGDAGADFEAVLDELATDLPPLPVLPADFSRADIYGDRD